MHARRWGRNRPVAGLFYQAKEGKIEKKDQPRQRVNRFLPEGMVPVL
jgi:hypothetical protein